MSSNNLVIQLKEAIERGNIAEVKALIDKGAVPQKASVYYSPLVRCIQHNKLEIAKYLIQIGANTTELSVDNEQPKTPLYWAIDTENLEMVKLLLDNGADFTIYENLIPAIKKNNLEIVRELVQRGADVNSSSGRHELPILCALRNGNSAILKLLIANGANVDAVAGSITSAILVGTRSCEILKVLLENGANVNVVDGNGDTLLTKSVRLMNLPMTEYLVRSKANLNVKTKANETPLSIALSMNDFRTFRLLIESGADPKLATEAIAAMRRKNRDFAAYMRKLGNASADPQRTGYTGHEAA